jgi:hypothetical protein
MGAILAFNFDPSQYQWEAGRIVVVEQATWTVALNDSLASKLRATVSRRVRQAQGSLEMAAIREHFAVARKGPGELPETAHALMGGWMQSKSIDAIRLVLGNPLVLHTAIRVLRGGRSQTDSPNAQLVGRTKASDVNAD